MTRTEFRHEDVDKAEWGAGPWVDEPDKIVWVDEATDLDCMIHRNGAGALCGYVGVGPGHPWHGKHYRDLTVEVHGSLTYSDKCNEKATEDNGICHVPLPGREHDIWWVGFDCAHQMDVAPGYNQYVQERPVAAAIHDLSGMLGMLTGLDQEPTDPGSGTWGNPTYKTVEWVTEEVQRLAAQAAQA